MAPIHFALLMLATSSPASDWPQFRGPESNSVLAQRDYPAQWGPDENVAWEVDVEGSGWSSPIVIGDFIFLTSAVDPTDDGPAGMREGVSDPSTRGQAAKPADELTYLLTCLDLEDGAVLWAREVGTCIPKYPVHRSNTFATESPASDGERVFVTFGALGMLVAYELDGGELWRVETGVYRTGNDFGWGISLATYDGIVFLQNDNEEESFLAAFDAEMGSELWRVPRAKGTSWGSPAIVETEARVTLVACGPDTVIGYSPEDGEEQWRIEGIGGSFSSSPTYDETNIYFGNSGPMRRGPLLAVSVDAEGTLDLRKGDEPPLAWRAKRAGPGFASPVVHDGLIYILASTNVLACYDAATGEQLYKERVPDAVTVVACPWMAGDELHILDEEGTTVVVRAGREFEVVRTNRMPGLYWGTPAVAGDALLLREAKKLYCIRD